MRLALWGLAAALGASAGVASADGLSGTMNFSNVTSSRVVALPEGQSSEKEVEVGDFDKDGDLDVVVAVGASSFGARKNKLYRNDGGTLIEISGPPVIPDFALEDVSRNAFFRDFNSDGWLDIYIVNDDASPGFAGQHKLYLNVQSEGYFSHFVSVSDDLPHSGYLGAACGGAAADFSGDGAVDVYSGNYSPTSQDRMIFGDGNGAMADVTTGFVPIDADYTVDVATADLNGDGKMDLLVSNEEHNWVYYNDLAGAGSEQGDFNYPGSAQDLGDETIGMNAMEPGDLDGDGRLDVYWTDASGATMDRILRNMGNDASGRVIFQSISDLPPSVMLRLSSKATVSDLNGDGRLDVFVMTPASAHPTILRNTTVNGQLSFVDWTPATTFPPNGVFRGWHAAAFDASGDGDEDLLIGAFAGDHLFENVGTNPITEQSLGTGSGGPLPPLVDQSPVAVTGKGLAGPPDDYSFNAVSESAALSVVLRSAVDYRLEVVAAANLVVASSDRGGLGVEEALRLDLPGSGNYKLRVKLIDCGNPVNDIDNNCEIGLNDAFEVLIHWGACGAPCPTDVNGDGVTGFSDLIQVLLAWGTLNNAYTLEAVARTPSLF